MGEVPGALSEAVVVIDLHPFLAPIVGAIKSSRLRFDLRVNAVRVRSRNGQTDLAQNPLGQAVAFQMLPRASAVRRFVEPAARAAAGQAVRRAVGFIKGGVED